MEENKIYKIGKSKDIQYIASRDFKEISKGDILIFDTAKKKLKNKKIFLLTFKKKVICAEYQEKDSLFIYGNQSKDCFYTFSKDIKILGQLKTAFFIKK